MNVIWPYPRSCSPIRHPISPAGWAVITRALQPFWHAYRVKEDLSVVTEADLAADRLIADAIRTTYPQDGLVSEELCPSSPSETEAVWVVDPLDGTPTSPWASLLGRLYCAPGQRPARPGCPVFPLLDELYTAQRGGGVMLNGNPVQVKPPSKTNPRLLCLLLAHSPTLSRANSL